MRHAKTVISLTSVIFLALLVLASCHRHAPAAVPRSIKNSKNSNIKLLKNCWLRQPTVYRLRQSAVVEYGNKKEIFEGFIELDLPKSRARLVIFTDLGVTLLNLEIRPHSYSFADTGNEGSKVNSRKKREKQFAAAVAATVQNIFFALQDYEAENSRLELIFNKPATGLPEPARISEKPSQPGWIVNYNNYRNYPCGRLPQQIILQNFRPDFKLTLSLHNMAKSE